MLPFDILEVLNKLVPHLLRLFFGFIQLKRVYIVQDLGLNGGVYKTNCVNPIVTRRACLYIE